MCVLHEDVCTIMTVSRWITLKVRNVLGDNCRENQSKLGMYNNFFFKSCHVWANVEKYDAGRQVTYYNIIRRMRLACW